MINKSGCKLASPARNANKFTDATDLKPREKRGKMFFQNVYNGDKFQIKCTSKTTNMSMFRSRASPKLTHMNQ